VSKILDEIITASGKISIPLILNIFEIYFVKN
jgi:hypothetical protein